MFKANAARDFSFQREMVEVFGTEAVKAFNNFSWWERSALAGNRKGSELEMTPEKLAELGGFNEDFSTLKAAMNQGQEIALPGMKGTFKSTSV